MLRDRRDYAGQERCRRWQRGQAVKRRQAGVGGCGEGGQGGAERTGGGGAASGGGKQVCLLMSRTRPDGFGMHQQRSRGRGAHGQCLDAGLLAPTPDIRK